MFTMKVLLINPSKWGRGITPIWVASHSAILKSKGHEVKLFDCTFYSDWSDDEITFNTINKQYKPSDYFSYVSYKKKSIFEDLQRMIDEFKPDVLFWSAISSHIHGEGEYVNIQYGYDLTKNINLPKICAGLQPTASPKDMPLIYPNIDYFILGESELVLCNLLEALSSNLDLTNVNGLYYKKNGYWIKNKKQEIILNMDLIPPYDYSIFEDQIFYRPYNGEIVRAVDYEMSRGCIYSCAYCVETVIQKYYGFTDNNDGVIIGANKYLRNKSAMRILKEMKYLHETYGITLFRCQDTNFLTIKILRELADLMDAEENFNIKLYVETRPENVNLNTIELLKRLKVDGVGMGIELSTETFRKNNLNRFVSQKKIIEAFKLLKIEGIKRTSYNIIGLPEQGEQSILETIRFNNLLCPDNLTVAFYSPYLGTQQEIKARQLKYFDENESFVDGQLRSCSKSPLISRPLLDFYKKNFTYFVQNGLENLENMKSKQLERIDDFSKLKKSASSEFKSKIVIGTWSLSGDYGSVDLSKIQEVLLYCYEKGLREFDTAPSYGNGFMEFCLGSVFGNKSDVLINSKIGNSPFYGKSFIIGDLKKSFECTLKRLKRDNINILFLHNPRTEIHDYDSIHQFMDELKRDGKINFKGISLAKGYDYSSIDLNRFDVVQDDANLLSMDYKKLILSEKTLFMARSPLASGLLSGNIAPNTVFEKNDHRSFWLKGDRLISLMKRVDKIRGQSNLLLPIIARKFLLEDTQINRIIFGIKKKEHVDDLLRDLSTPLLPEKLRNNLYLLFKQDFGLIDEKHLRY